MTDLRPPLEAPFRDFGRPATVTVPGGVPVNTRAIVETVPVEVPVAGGGGLSFAERRTQISLRRDAAPDVPTETVIVIGSTTWKVDAIASQDDEVIKVLVR